MDARFNSIKSIWKAINRVCSYKNDKRNVNIKQIMTDQGPIYNSHDIANQFNNYFTSVGDSLASKIIHSPDGYKEFLPSPNPNSIFIQPVIDNEVFNTILSLKTNHSTGHDGIGTKILQLAANYIAPPLTHIINKSFELGIFPDTFKTAKVIPIYKKEIQAR